MRTVWSYIPDAPVMAGFIATGGVWAYQGMGMRIFCTGASGYIGGSVAAHLIAAGHQVTGLVRSPEKAEAVRARGIQPVLGTLDDSEPLAGAAGAADIVVNAASADHKGAVVALL